MVLPSARSFSVKRLLSTSSLLTLARVSGALAGFLTQVLLARTLQASALGVFYSVTSLAATSVDYPGSLLDVRHLIDDDVHEVERSLSLVATLGHALPPGDDGRLRVRRPASPPVPALAGPFP